MIKRKKLYLFVIIIAAVFIAEHIIHLSEYVTYSFTYVSSLVEQNFMLAVLLYCALTIIGCVILALPGISFAIAAGALFGPWVGTLCCSCATTIGAVLAFLAGRYFLKDSIEQIAKKNRYLKKWLFEQNKKNELFILMITRLVPLFPYNLQNFAYGITGISLKTYTFGSCVFMFPGTAMYTIGAAGLTATEHQLLYIVIAVFLAGWVLAVSMFLKNKYFREENDGRK